MERPLARLGRLCVRRRWLVLAVWLVAVVGIVLAAQSAGTRTTNDLSLPGTGTQAASDLLNQRFPSQAAGSSPVVLGAAPGRAIPHDVLSRTTAALRDAPAVATVGAPQVSPDGRVASLPVTLSVAPSDLTPDTAQEILDRGGAPARAAGLTVAAGGLVGTQATPQGAHDSESIGLLVAIVVLLFAFGSVVAMGLPLLTGLLGLACGISLVTLLSHVVAVPSVGPTLGAMIGLGVGIDYALFVIARHRELLATGMSVPDSIVSTVDTTGAAIAFAGGTVVVALLSLGLAEIPIVAALGYCSAAMVAVAIVAALTLMPALLALLGHRIEALRVPALHRRAARSGAHGWERWAQSVARRPWTALLVSLVLLGVLAAPALGLRLGQADAATQPPGTPPRVAYDLLSDGFGPGVNGPLLVAVRIDDTGASLTGLGRALSATPGVASVTPPLLDKDGDAAVITVVPRADPAAPATEALVRRLRDTTIPQALEGTGLTAYVGGQTAAYIDLADLISSRLAQVIGTVIALSVLLLLVAFRSVLVPLSAAAMNLVSIGAAYGVVTAVFQHGWGVELIGLDQPTPIVSFVPLLMFAILFGLSMDYEVFLLTHIQERWTAGRDNRAAVVGGLASSARVITSAALIMVSVFASFLLDGDPTIKQFGLGMAVAVAIDATIVRCLLVPATMLLIGRANWWLPQWLDRILPRISIEGGGAAEPPRIAID